jgi:hypothetical protein
MEKYFSDTKFTEANKYNKREYAIIPAYPLSSCGFNLKVLKPLFHISHPYNFLILYTVHCPLNGAIFSGGEKLKSNIIISQKI